MAYINYFNSAEDEKNEPYPEYFQVWDEAVNNGLNPGYFEADDLCEIIDIYLSESEITKAKFAIDYAFKLYPENEELVYEILLLLNDYERWNDLLDMSEKYKDMPQVWADGHKVTALLHLGMEEDAFHFFRKMKTKYAKDKENLSVIYQAMGEALQEVDLYDASIDVIDEAITLLGQEVDLLWLQVQGYIAMDDKESVIELSETIQKMNPMDAETWSRLGNIYKEIGDTEKTIEAFEFAHSLGLKDPNNLMDMIYAYEKNGNLNKAIEKTEEYLSIYPDSYLVNLMAANICSQVEDWEKALKYIENTIVLEPDTESLYLYKSNFLLKLGEQKKAIMVLEEGIKKTKDTAGDLKKQLDSLRKQFPEY